MGLYGGLSEMKNYLQLFETGFQNQTTNLDILRTFDNHFAKYLISKVSWMHWLYF